MFGYINQRLSIPARLALVCLLLAIPSVLAMTLFVAQSWKDIAFADKEVAGVEYLQQIWPSMVATANGGESIQAANAGTNKADAEFGTTNASADFRNAPDRGKRLAEGVALITAVADGSNLTLDPDLDS